MRANQAVYKPRKNAAAVKKHHPKGANSIISLLIIVFIKVIHLIGLKKDASLAPIPYRGSMP